MHQQIKRLHTRALSSTKHTQRETKTDTLAHNMTANEEEIIVVCVCLLYHLIRCLQIERLNILTGLGKEYTYCESHNRYGILCIVFSVFVSHSPAIFHSRRSHDFSFGIFCCSTSNGKPIWKQVNQYSEMNYFCCWSSSSYWYGCYAARHFTFHHHIHILSLLSLLLLFVGILAGFTITHRINASI